MAIFIGNPGFLSILLLLVLYRYIFPPTIPYAHRWFDGLLFWCPPTKEAVDNLVKNKTGKKGLRNRKKSKSQSDELHLEQSIISSDLFVGQDNFSQFDDLNVLAVIALVSFLVAEFWACMTRFTSEFGFISISLSVIFCIWRLFQMTTATGYSGFEFRIAAVIFIIMSAGAFYLLTHFEDALDFGFSQAYGTFQQEMTQFVRSNVPESSNDKDISKLKTNFTFDLQIKYIYFGMAIVAGFISMITLLPALRSAKCYLHISAQPREEVKTWTKYWFIRMLAHASVLLPLGLSLLWINPLTKDALVNDSTIITDQQYQWLRNILVLLFCGGRILLMREYVQAFLSSSIHSMGDSLQQLTAETATKLQQVLTQVLLYAPSMAMQHLCPTLTSLFLMFLTKRKTEVNWGVCDILMGEDTPAHLLPKNDPSFAEKPFTLVHHSLMAPSLQFLLFWSLASWFILHSLSVLYLRRMTAQFSQ